MTLINRRDLLFRGSAAFLTAAGSLATPAIAKSTPVIAIKCAHTGASCAIKFDGSISSADADAFRKVTQDWRAQKQHKMDLRLVRTLSRISNISGSDETYTLLSGYRTPATNIRLRGTASRSYHMEGRALDIRRSDLSTRELYDIAWGLKAGGVGYYPQKRNRFVHVDTAGLRTW